MTEVYQNLEQSQLNPQSPPPKLVLPQPKDPKIKLLMILGIIIVILLIISALVSFTRKKQPPTFPRPKTTPTESIIRPTDIPEASVIPQELKNQFDRADSDNQININFPPPQIDPEIGL